MTPVRLFGDPFGDDANASALRAFLRTCRANDVDAAVAIAPGARTAPIDGALAASDLALLHEAFAKAVPSTSPVVVFAPAPRAADWRQLASLRWPQACKVLPAGRADADELLLRVRAELRWAGTEDPEHAVDLQALRPWLQLSAPPADGPVLHLGSRDPAAGTDLVVRVFAQRFAADGVRLRIVLPDAQPTFVELLRQQANAIAPAGVDAAAAIEFICAPLEAAHARDCRAVLQPLRLLHDAEALVQLLASARPVAATRCAASAALFAAPGVCAPIGGRALAAENAAPACCEPDPRSIAHALRSLLDDAGEAAAIGQRGRAHVLEHLTADRPASPPPPSSLAADARSPKPIVVLEAPFFEVSSSAELSIATAQALLRRGNVELRLVPTRPFDRDLATLRTRAPELEPLLVREPGAPDLWLATGWPPRLQRPRCGMFAQRFDWEYGTLPVDLCPALPQEADHVVVHSRHVQRTLAAAGRPVETMSIVPHGVDADLLHEHAEPDAEIVAWKRELPAVLFCGGLVFRKGFDVCLRAVLDAARAGRRFAVVVKAIGHDRHYANFHLGGLVERFQRTPGAPPLLFVDGELPRARMAGIYRACDLLLHPYRGEGFGMPVLEARACGLPVLVTKGGATDDFAVGPGAIQLPAQRREIDLGAPHVGQPWLLEPDADAAGRALVQALDDLPALQAQARGFAGALRQSCSWDNAAAAVERLANLATGRRRARQPVRATAVERDIARV